MPLSSLYQALDPEAMRQSWQSWFSMRRPTMAPEVVQSHELRNIREW